MLDTANIPLLVHNIFLIGGSFLLAVFMTIFLWNLGMYAMMKGDDAHRAHAKMSILNWTLNLLILLFIWWLLSLAGRVVGL